MATFKASLSIDDGIMKLIVNGKTFLLVKSGETKNKSTDLGPGKHVVQWYVEGAPGTFYTLEISAPESAVVSIKKVIKPIGKDYGSFSFDL